MCFRTLSCQTPTCEHILMASSKATSKISEFSGDAVTSGVDLFTVPHSHIDVLAGEWHEVPAVRDNALGVLEFIIPPTDSYTDLAKTYLYTECKVTKDDGTNLDANTDNVKVIPVENFMHSLFRTAAVSYGSKNVEFNQNYPYKAYLETILNHGAEAKKTHLFSTSGWIQDSMVGIDGTKSDGSDILKADVVKRKKLIAGSEPLSFYGRLHLSTFSQERFLIPGLRCKVTLTRTDGNFPLLATATAPTGGGRVEITKASLFVRRPVVNPTVIAEHNKMLMEGETVKYPGTSVRTQFHVINEGVRSVRINLDQEGQKPKRIILGLVDHKANNGDYSLNPFNFQNASVSSLELVVDGIPLGKRYEPNYEKKLYAREYSQLAFLTERSGDCSNGITYEGFGNGQALYAFDLTGDLCTDGVHLISNASLTVNIAFAVATTATLSLLAYSEYDELTEINLEHQIRMVGGVV